MTDGAKTTSPDPDAGLFASIGQRLFGRVGSREQSSANRGWQLITTSSMVLGIVLIGLIASSWRQFAAGGLLALAAASVGSMIGFLFGLPRSARTDSTVAPAPVAQGSSASPQAGYRPNSNLEDISDWLTKILVGLGLTQIGSIPSIFKSLMDLMAVVLGTGSDASAIAGSVIVGYLVLGFLATYLWARTRLSRAFELGDAAIDRINRMETQIDTLTATITPGA